MNLARKIPLVAMIPFIMSISSSCNKGPQTFTAGVKEPSSSGKAFNEIDLNITHKDMTSHGFEYGDIVELTAKSKDGKISKTMVVPYVTNYNEAGTYGPCLCDYESKGRDLSVSTGFQTDKIEEAKFFTDGQCEIKIKEKGGYKKKRDLISVPTKLSYEQCGRENMKFANSRDVIEVGEIYKYIKAGTLFRGSSPIANSKNNERYIVADNYMRYHQIQHDISLSLTEDNLREIYYGSEKKEAEKTVGAYTKSLYEGKHSKLYTVSLGSDFFKLDKNKGGTISADVFTHIATSDDTSFYIHCNEGKDRTGFFIMVLEALCGVTLDDLVADYMLTFNNYYNINNVDDTTKEKYDAMANLTCYRNIYSFMLAADDNLTDGTAIYNKLGTIDMLSLDSKAEVNKLMEGKDKNTYLQTCAVKYLQKINVGGSLTEGNIKSLFEKFHRNSI